MDHNSTITLEGSSSLVVKFFECGLNSILYQRGLYPPDDFRTTTKYGLKLLMSINPELTGYINKITQQIQVWMENSIISKIVIVITSRDTDEVLERWHFDIQVNGENGLPMAENVPPSEANKIQAQAVKQIRAILRQITASVSYLPMIEGEDCTFNVLVYADKDVDVPNAWGDSGPSLIKGGGEHVRLNSFSTLIHKVDSFVAYKMDESY